MQDRDVLISMFAYDDLMQCREALASIPRGVETHVFDGRWIEFPADGSLDYTPGLRDLVASYPNSVYHCPPHDALPFGDPDGIRHRAGVHEKTVYAYETVLPSDAWVLSMDTDERIDHIDTEAIRELDPGFRYRPFIPIDDGRVVSQSRLFVPEEWTFWVDDCLMPRDEVPRDTPLDVLQDIYFDYHRVRVRPLDSDILEMHNVGGSRNVPYVERRITNLEAIGRHSRANKLREYIKS